MKKQLLIKLENLKLEALSQQDYKKASILREKIRKIQNGK
jgi:hypothetical protein